ncbi:MAG TPA: hypothetical protein VFL14_14480 [Xanthomonadales bacterium]|nr:hypothetical protein [Xanthomonadales bacterium]
MLRFATLCAVFLAQSALAAGPAAGLWYDRTSPGLGVDLQRAGDVLFGAVYGHARDTRPAWWWFQLDARAGSTSPLLHVRRAGPGLELAAVGSIAFAPVAQCADGLPRPDAIALLQVDVVLDGSTARWCLEPLVAPGTTASAAVDGAWYDAREPGWGVFVHHYEQAGREQVYATTYYHDAMGEPRWSFAQEIGTGATQALRFFALRNECFLCGTSSVLAYPVGDGALALGAGDRFVLAVGEPGEAPFMRDAVLSRLGDAPRR